jgi:exonuclease VII small subunit
MAILDEVEALLRIARKAKTTAEFEKTITQLEAEVLRLKKQLAEFEPRGERCKSCGHLTLFLAESKRSATFGALGAQDRTYTCRLCGKSEERLEVPGD